MRLYHRFGPTREALFFVVAVVMSLVPANARAEVGGLALSMLYLGGVERPRGAPEGRAWRHVFDLHATWQALRWLALMGHMNGGTEPNHFGTSSWIAGAVYARFLASPKLSFVVRGDAFRERVPSNSDGSASPLFWPVPWVASGTATVDFRPHARTSFRLEVRHDSAAGKMFFGDTLEGDGRVTPFVANRNLQNTVTVGATTWF